jgi:glycosyltransferase involved in cell wall biosynthesis
MKARLALVHYTAPPVTGGVESVMAAQARQLQSAGYEVRLVAGRGDAELLPELDSRHPDVADVTHGLQAGKDVRRRFLALQARLQERLACLLADRDLVIAHNVMTMPFNLPLVAALAELKLPLIAWTHDVAWLNEQYEDFQQPEWPYQLMGQPQRGVTYVAISHLRQRELARTFRIPSSAIPVVPNGIEPNEFVGIRPRALQLLKAASALNADPLLLVPQRVAPAKRLELAIDAAARLRRRLPGLRMVVTGPLGPHSLDDQAYAAKLVEHRAHLGLESVVSFLFEQPRNGSEHAVRSEDVADMYRVSDVVVMPSGSEGFGLPVLEAAVARVPLVCADIPVLREVGGDEMFTFPVDGDGRDVAAAVARALESKAVRHRRLILKRFAWPGVLETTERIIAEALAPPVAIAQ